MSTKVEGRRAPRRASVGLPKGMATSTNIQYGINMWTKKKTPTEPYLVLGIETSCDDTAAAVVSSTGELLGQAVLSQHEIHAPMGGIVPNLAKKAHEEAIENVVKEALAVSNISSLREIGAIAATYGPGLEICLRVGAKHAAQLAREYNKTFVQVHHLEAHCLVARFAEPELKFPFLALLVSGGHCQLLKCIGVGQFSLLGGTLDDALGEAYDKAARLLRLAAPTGGGPALEKVALEGNFKAIDLPIPMRRRKDCDFSYAGLKNSFRLRVDELRAQYPDLQDHEPLPPEITADLAASFQRVAIIHLNDRLRHAFELLADDPDFFPSHHTLSDQNHTPSLALVGGVAANKKLRSVLSKLCADHGWNLFVPPPALCTDNGVMAAWSAIEKLRLGYADDPEDTEVFARWPFSPPETFSSSSSSSTS